MNVGQAVVSSFNIPSMFLVATDLRRMVIWVPVNENDIGNIHPDQEVAFTVSTLPGEIFHGRVTQIRNNAAMNQNVVTYTVVVEVDNSYGKFMPYLTARAQFQVQERKDVLVLPNSALRWRPDAARIHPQYREEAAALLAEKEAEGNPTAAGSGRPRSYQPTKLLRSRNNAGQSWLFLLGLLPGGCFYGLRVPGLGAPSSIDLHSYRA